MADGSGDGDGDDTGGTDTSDIDMLRVAREEAHRTVDSQSKTLDDIDSKAARVLRVNLVLLGVVLTGISVAVNAHPGGERAVGVLADLANYYTVAGIVLLLASTAVAAVTYTASDLRTGMSGKDLRAVLDNEYDYRQNLEGIVESYSHWIEHNFRTNAKNAPLETLTLLLLVYAMTALALGTDSAVTGDVEWWLLDLAIIANGLLTWHTEFHRQLRRLLRIR